MNKRMLKSYLNKSIRDYLKTNCFEYDRGYLVTDGFSIIKLNDKSELNIAEDKAGVEPIYDDFKKMYKYRYQFEGLTFLNNTSIDDNKIGVLCEGYGCDIQRFKRISAIINANKFCVLDSLKSDLKQVIIRLENTKTKEIAYLLPVKLY